MFTISQQSAIPFLTALDRESIDLVIIDPAYESLEKHRAKGTTTRLKKEWFAIFPNTDFPALFCQLYRVMAWGSHLYLLCDAETMFVVRAMGEAAGFKFWKPIVWDKVNIGMGYHYRGRCEFILFFEKGKRRLNDLSVADVLPVKRVYGGYPTEKPVELLEILIKQSSSEGDLILDCFVGSGSTAEAAIRQGRNFVGCDLSSAAVTNAIIRCDAVLEELAEESRQCSLL